MTAVIPPTPGKRLAENSIILMQTAICSMTPQHLMENRLEVMAHLLLRHCSILTSKIPGLPILDGKQNLIIMEISAWCYIIISLTNNLSLRAHTLPIMALLYTRTASSAIPHGFLTTTKTIA